MTNDYKEALLKYLTGNLQTDYNSYEIIASIEENDVTTNNLDTYLTNQLGNTYTIVGMLQNEKYENCIIYGTHVTNSKTYGFLLITDNKFNHIKLITTYNSGTLLGRFYKLEIDEKNQLYGIDYNPDTTQYRFIMLNNVFKSEEAVLRQSYNLPNEVSAMNMNGIQITKDPTSANYLIAGIVFKGNVNQPVVAKFTINVGTTNEWTYYEYAGTLLGAEGNLSNIYATWNNGIPDFKMSAYSANQMLLYFSWYYHGNNLINVELYDIGSHWTTTTIYNLDSIVADINTCYYGVHAMADGNEELSLFQIKDGVQTFLTGLSLSGATTDSEVKFKLKVENGTLFYVEISPNNSQYNVYAGLYKENVVNQTMELANNISVSGNIFSILNSFNLYQYNLQIGNNLYYLKILYNPSIDFSPLTSGYNNPEDFKPLSMSLYDGEDIIFNRTLYNLVTSGSTTTSTIEVPNTMLNSNTIDGENLIGNHHLEISENTEAITTNIYETLHINAINTLSIINSDTGMLFPSGSARLNSSININRDYINTQVGKIKINYTDNTSRIMDVQAPTNNNMIWTYEFAIYVPKSIRNIEIISHDEATVYQRFTGTFEIGKYYKITQEVTID